MYLDEFGLPVQKNGDNQDQLQRTGMVGVGQLLNPTSQTLIPPLIPPITISGALKYGLQPRDGVYRRFIAGPTNTATGDQLVTVAAYWCITRNARELLPMHHVLAQNTVSIFGGAKTFPDFILVRMIPFLVRAHWALYPLALVMDILLLLAVLIRVTQGSLTDTDDNDMIMTVAVCKAVMPTPLSWLSAKLYKHLRRPPGLVGALRAYHASSTGGNPEIAELWVPIVERF